MDITLVTKKIEQLSAKMDKLSTLVTPTKLKRVRSKGQAMPSPFRNIRTENDESCYSIHLNSELLSLESKIKMFTRRKEFLERNRTRTQHSDNRSQTTMSHIS